MKKIKRICAVMLSAVMVTGTLACGNVGALSTNSTSNVENNISQKIIYPKETEKNKEKTYVEGEAVVMMKGDNLVSTGASLDSVMDVSANIKVESSSDFNEKRDNFSVVTVSSDKLSTEDILDELKGQEDVLVAEPNYIYKATSITNDTYSDFQWALENKGINNGTAGEDIKPVSMWSKESTSKETPVVAVVDTGVDYNHEDLKDNMWVNPYQDKLAGVHGYDCTGTFDNGEPMDNHGHGTHCAGIIAAQKDNNKGISGVADNVKIMAIKYLDDNNKGTLENAVTAYNYIYNAMKLGVNVVAINNSWGGNNYSEILLSLINKVGKAGAVSVCAAGNDSINFDASNGDNEDNDDIALGSLSVDEEDYDEGYEEERKLCYPACYDSEYIISVAATGIDGKLADYSNYGENTIDIAAPGTDILSTVCYNNFIPAIYSQDKLNDVCHRYITKDFNAKTIDLGENQGFGTATLSEKNTGYYDGLGDSTCLEYNITVDEVDEVSGNCFAFEVPYTVDVNDNNVYYSMMVNTVGNTDYDISEDVRAMSVNITDCAGDEELILQDKNWNSYENIVDRGSDCDWCVINDNNLINNKETSERKLVFLCEVNVPGSYTLRIDNIGISKGIVGEEETFGKYDIYDGTSMATPYVTGSVALIKDKYSDISVKELISKVKNSVNQNNLVDNKVKSNGVLSLDKFGTYIPKIQSWTAYGNKTIVKGSDFKDITKVTVNGEDVKYTVNSSEEIIINDNSYFNGHCDLMVYSKGGYDSYTGFFLKGTRYTDNGELSYNSILNYNTVSDGKYLYNIYYNNLVRYSINKNGVLTYDNNYDFYYLLNNNYDDITNNSEVTINTSSPIYYNGKIYFIVDYALMNSSSKIPYMSRNIIITFDVSNCKMSIKEINDIGLYNQSLAFYNKEMYLIGGYDIATDTLSKNVYKYSSSKWQKVASLPSARAMGKCVQYGNKLVYTLGISNSDECPNNLIYDGKTWTESKSNLGLTDFSEQKVYKSNFNYYSCGVDLVTNGILYTGEMFGSDRDTVVYNPNNDSYSAMNYYFHTDSENDIYGAVVGNKFYGNGSENGIAHTYSFNVKTGMYNVAVTSKYGKVTGGGYYMPNTVATISATPNKNYKVKSIVVNGKTYNKSKVQFTVTKDTTVKVNYIAMVTKVKLNKTSLTMKKGKTYQLKATVTPNNATNKKVTWTSTNKTVATVNSKGKVKAVKKGTCKIKCTAKDGSKKSATCKVTVKK